MMPTVLRYYYILLEMDPVLSRANRCGEVATKKEAEDWVNKGIAEGKNRTWHEHGRLEELVEINSPKTAFSTSINKESFRVKLEKTLDALGQADETKVLADPYVKSLILEAMISCLEEEE